MEDIINIGTFVSYLSYYLKVGAYLNKDTTDETNKVHLQNCIKLYNKYRKIEGSAETSEKDIDLVRKCLKRLNLVLKVDADGNPVNLKDKDNQRKILFLKPCDAILNKDRSAMIAYAKSTQMDILTDIPLTFMLQGSSTNDMPWLYTQSLFHISQMLISSGATDATDEVSVQKQNE